MPQVTDTQQLKEVIDGAHKILMVSGPRHALDNIVSLIALKLSLEDAGKEIRLLAENINKESFSGIPGINSFSEETEPRNLRIGIRYGAIPVDKINYENREGIFEVILSPYAGNFSKDQIELTYTGLNYDLILTLGAQKLEELGSLYLQHQPTLEKTLLINIDNDDRNALFGRINLVDAQTETKAQMVYDVISALNIPSSPETATLLLTSVMKKTQTMREDVSPRLLRFSALLLDKNADWKQALSFAESTGPETVAETPVDKITPVDESKGTAVPAEAAGAEAVNNGKLAETLKEIPHHAPVAPISPLARPLDTDEKKFPSRPIENDDADLMR